MWYQVRVSKIHEPTELPDVKKNINNSQYWETPDYNLKRINCSLETSDGGKILPPKIYAFDSIVNDLMD